MAEYTRIKISTRKGWMELGITRNGAVEVLAESSLAVVPRAGNVVHLHITRKA